MLSSLETQTLLWPEPGVVALLPFLQAPLLECTLPVALPVRLPGQLLQALFPRLRAATQG